MPLSKKQLAALAAVMLALEEERPLKAKALFEPSPTRSRYSSWADAGRRQNMADNRALQLRLR